MRQILLMMLAAASLVAADATGKWAGTLTPEGRDAGPALLVLKQEGAKLTGTAGPDEGERHDIQNGTADDGALTFEVASGGGLMKFVLKQDGEQLTGTITREKDGGQKQTATLALKREK